MKKLIIAMSLFSGITFFYACNGNNSETTETSTNDSVTTNSQADTMTNNVGTTMVDQSTKDFATDAATGGMMEVELGKLAEQKAASQQVKDFGKMMVDDHTKINDDLKTMASKKNIDLPASVTDDHKKDIDACKKAESKVDDNDFKNFITNSLPTLQKHLDAIQSIKSKM